MKKILFSLSLITSILAMSQNTGIGTTAPKATLEVKGTPATANTPDGIIAPRITRAELIAKTAYGSDQTSAKVYVTDTSGTLTAGTPTDEVTSMGYYYFDGTKWKKEAGSDWSIWGNAGTTPDKNFLGTTDEQPLVLKLNNKLAGYIQYSEANNLTIGKSSLLGIVNEFSFSTQKNNTKRGSNSGSSNVIFGHNSLVLSRNGSENVLVGNGILHSTTAPGSNTIVGNSTLTSGTDNLQNTMVGSHSAMQLQVGDENTTLGYSTLENLVSGSGNIAIGKLAALPQMVNGVANHQMSIGNSIYGLNINDGNATNDLIGIAATDPTERLDVKGNIRVRGTGTEPTGTCTNLGTISYYNDSFYGCTTTGWKKMAFVQ